MKYIQFFIMSILMIVLTACNDEEFPSINQHQSFVASMNILEPSLIFYDSSGEEIAKWALEKAYTGAELIDHDRILLYGHQLLESDFYELSSGKKLNTIETGIGTTNAYYDKEAKTLFLTNSKTNTVTSYDHKWNQLNTLKLRNYPMTMNSFDGKLFVINYKDTVLSVVDVKSLKLIEEWPIERSSSGMIVVPEEKALWIGGHGEGSRPNQSIKILNIETGEYVKEVPTSIMPVGFTKNKDEIYIVNHGANEVYATNYKGNILWHTEVGANPFAVAYFNDAIVVAGFDDHKLYFLKNGKIDQSIQTDKGPFQLLVREVHS